MDDAQFDAMVQSGQIRPTDLVWQEGMANWQTLATVRPTAPDSLAAGAPAGSADAPPVIAGPAGQEVTCVECGGRFSRDNAVQYGSTWVCAACKPAFVQKLKEGMPVGGGPGVLGSAGFAYAGFWIRFAAKFIDGLIIGAVLLIPMLVLLIPTFTAVRRGGPPPEMGLLVQAVLQLGMILGTVGFNTFFLAKYGATPGKMAVGIKVVSADGTPLTLGRAFGRAWADQLSCLVCYIGYIIVAFDSEKRALHDHICNTRVVYK